VFHDRFATLIADLARSVRENPSVDLVAFNATVAKLAATDIDVRTVAMTQLMISFLYYSLHIKQFLPGVPCAHLRCS
jgi:hypothetical protein